MATGGGTCLYKEARLNIEPAFPGSTISLTLPASTTSTFSSRPVPKRTVITEQYIDQDEEAFAKRHLASEGSMFFRRHHEYPRSFLWRILDNRKALEIQSADLDQDFNHKFEANLTLILQFAAPIRPFCVAFADSEERDALTVFAITTANELYTITLHRDFFMKPAASEQEIGDWCKRSSPTLFMNRVPYRLVAPSVHELLVSLDDGAILYMTKKNKDDVVWSEATYQQNNWSLGSFLSWKGQQSVRFDNADLDSSAAAAISLSPDNKHIFSVCLNHRLRAWNVTSGKPGVQRDLLDETHRANEKAASYFIGPSQSTLMAIVNIPGGVDGALYYVVTYSPRKHQFKFWGIRDADDTNLGIYDAKPEVSFIPPVDDLMNTTVWTLEEFFIIPGPAGWRGAELWIRARSGPSSKVYSVRFDLTDESARLEHTWQNDWISVDSGLLTVDGLKQDPANPSERDMEASELYEVGLTEQWLDFFFYPGRFTVATLETALLIFRRGLDRSRSGRGAVKGSLKERICTTVAIFASLKQNGTIDSDEYENAMTAQWQAFYGLVKDLHKRRGESLSLAYDYELEMPWLVLSDYLSAIRKGSHSEIIALNAPALSSSHLSGPLRKSIASQESRNISKLLNAASSFRRGLPSSVHPQFRRQVESELFQSRSMSVIDRMEILEQNSDLFRQVSEDDVSLLVEELGTDVKDLTTEMFLRAIALNQETEPTRTSSKKQITRFGLSALVRVSQETLDTHYNVMLDLLVLILFMIEEDISEDFDASEIFTEIVNQLKDCTILTWLVSTVWSHQASTGPSSEVMMTSFYETFRNSRKFPITQTVLEGIFGHRSFNTPLPRGLKTRLFTYWTREWLSEVFKENFDSGVEEIMGVLLLQKEYSLALDFSRFLAEGNWATYLKGRMHMALGENTLASVCFQKAAYNLGEFLGKK